MPTTEVADPRTDYCMASHPLPTKDILNVVRINYTYIYITIYIFILLYIYLYYNVIRYSI